MFNTPFLFLCREAHESWQKVHMLTFQTFWSGPSRSDFIKFFPPCVDHRHSKFINLTHNFTQLSFAANIKSTLHPPDECISPGPSRSKECSHIKCLGKLHIWKWKIKASRINSKPQFANAIKCKTHEKVLEINWGSHTASFCKQRDQSIIEFCLNYTMHEVSKWLWGKFMACKFSLHFPQLPIHIENPFPKKITQNELWKVTSWVILKIGLQDVLHILRVCCCVHTRSTQPPSKSTRPCISDCHIGLILDVICHPVMNYTSVP